MAAAHQLHLAATCWCVTVSNSLLLLFYACDMRVWLLVVVVLCSDCIGSVPCRSVGVLASQRERKTLLLCATSSQALTGCMCAIATTRQVVSAVVTSAAAAACALQLSFCPGVVCQELQLTVAVVSSHALVLAC